MEETETNAIRRCAMNRETLLASRFDAQAFAPGDAMAHTRLRPGRRHYHRIAERARGLDESVETGGIDAVVVGEEEFQAASFCNFARWRKFRTCAPNEKFGYGFASAFSGRAVACQATACHLPSRFTKVPVLR